MTLLFGWRRRIVFRIFLHRRYHLLHPFLDLAGLGMHFLDEKGRYPTMKMAVVLPCNHCRHVERLKAKGWGGILTGFTGCFSRILFFLSKKRAVQA
jgi:hypothetical protein